MTDLTVRLNHMDFNYLQRVKVYRLNDEGKWDDKGTGHVSVEYLEDSEPISYGIAIGHAHSLARWQSPETQRSDAVGLVVIDEEDNQTLLVHRISADDIYRRQEDTIISWTDPEVATDLALSFQETMGCSFIWDQICSVQRSIHFPSVGGLEVNARPVGDDLDHSGTSQDDDDTFREGGGAEALGLPPVELATLPLIAKTVAEVMPCDRDLVASLIVNDQCYIRKLVQLFRTCEELKNLEGLRLMFKIVKGIISLNDGHIFDIIFSDEYIMDTVGALEYDPDVTNFQDHRKFLREQVVFKETVPIRDPVILSKIHQTYRIGYIKDVILPRVLDDPTFATINSIMLFNNIQVVTALQNDSAFLTELFTRLRSPETPERNRRDLVLFVQEFCNLSKHLQPAVRSQLFSALVKHLGLFDLVKDILNDPDEGIRLSGCDILIVVLNHEPALLRTFLVHQPSNILFSELVEGMLTPSEGGLQAQLLEIMRMLLDSETMDTEPVYKSLFLEIFYEKYMDQMVQLLTDGCPPEPGSTELSNDSRRTVSPEILGNICELMCFCVQHHRFRIKYYVMRNHVVEKVLKLIRRKEKYLVVAAVRFLRTCVALKDEFYFRYIVNHNLFESIIGAFMANGNRYNLLNSAVLELIDFIRKENIKTLIVHLIEKYSSKLESIDYADTFRALKLKYEQILEGPPSSTRDSGGAVTGGGPDHGSRTGRDRHSHAGFSDARRRKDDRALDKDEEDYFNEDSDEEEDTATARVNTASQPHATKAILVNGNALDGVPFRESAIGLVDYEDEDEEMPPALGINGKDFGRVLEKTLLPAISHTDPIWQEVEDGTVAKRKTSLAASLEPTDATPPKRQKPEGSLAVDSDSQPEIFDSSRVVSDVASSEARGLAEPVTIASTSQDIITKVSEAASPEQKAMHQASSSDHISRSEPEAAVRGMDDEHEHQDLYTTPSDPDPVVVSISDNVGSVATDGLDVPAETAKETCEADEASGDVVREECANRENPTKSSEESCSARGSSKSGTDCCSVEDCNGFVPQSSERVGLGDGCSNSNISQQHTVNLNSEGKLTNLGADIMRTVSPTSPGSYPVR